MDVRLAALLRGARAGNGKLVARLAKTASPLYAWMALPGRDGICHAVRVVEGHLTVGVGAGRRTRWLSAHRALTHGQARFWGHRGFWHPSPHERLFTKPSKRVSDRRWRLNLEEWCRDPSSEQGR